MVLLPGHSYTSSHAWSVEVYESNSTNVNKNCETFLVKNLVFPALQH
jgi:hypothetical protein